MAQGAEHTNGWQPLPEKGVIKQQNFVEKYYHLAMRAEYIIG